MDFYRVVGPACRYSSGSRNSWRSGLPSRILTCTESKRHWRLFVLVSFFSLSVLDKAFEFTLISSIVSYRIVSELQLHQSTLHLAMLFKRNFKIKSALENDRITSISDSVKLKLFSTRNIFITISWDFSHRSERYWTAYFLTTRSQAVARIADRTDKNCRGHVT